MYQIDALKPVERNLCQAIAVGHSQLRHAIQGSSLDPYLGDLPLGCAQGSAKNRFETKDRCLG
jgi:hypothetical protein